MLTNSEKLTAALYAIGRPMTIPDNKELADILDWAAHRWPSMFGSFARPARSRDIPTLNKAIHELMMDDLIEMVDPDCFRATKLALGKEGREAFNDLLPKERHRVISLAQRLRSAFARRRFRSQTRKEACISRPRQKMA